MLVALPELLNATPRTQELPDLLLRFRPSLPAAFLKAGTDGLDGPVDDRVGGVVEHLADDLTTNAGVAAPLDLDQRRNRILVEEQVVQRPPVAPCFLGRNAHLPRGISW